MAEFPLKYKQDSSQYSETSEDVAIREKMEGGYVYTRPKFTRTARKTFVTGFTNIDNADKVILEAFWNSVKGGCDIFDWANPVTSVMYSVRFTKALLFEYVGVGGVHRWDVKGIELEQV